jgi:hypothetical protein
MKGVTTPTIFFSLGYQESGLDDGVVDVGDIIVLLKVGKVAESLVSSSFLFNKRLSSSSFQAIHLALDA